VCHHCQNNLHQQLVINNNQGVADNEKGLIENKIEVGINHHTINFFYKLTFKKEQFNYITMINEKWWQTMKTDCSYCHRYPKYNHSACQSCYKHCYNQFYNQWLVKYQLVQTLFDTDVTCYLLYYFLDIFNVKYSIIYKLFNPTYIITITIDDIYFPEFEEPVFEKDLITADTLDFYLEDEIKDDELGYWSDDC